jgi:hypothetical protein
MCLIVHVRIDGGAALRLPVDRARHATMGDPDLSGRGCGRPVVRVASLNDPATGAYVTPLREKARELLARVNRIYDGDTPS